MIPITINKVKHSIKRIDELSTGEFIEMSKIDGLDVVKYIAWQTGLTIDEAFFAECAELEGISLVEWMRDKDKI